jgi:hypothetical protein
MRRQPSFLRGRELDPGRHVLLLSSRLLRTGRPEQGKTQ